MKKLLIVGIVTVMLSTLLAGCGTAKKTTEYWSYNAETGKNELEKVEEEPIDGIFDEHVKITFGEVIVSEMY